ncbi:MAG TPA: glycosyltransferase family A protein [Kofleriaceae bacterium]|nr:glycosyltransferase family A protein [Kofleriaceae bacterium]
MRIAVVVTRDGLDGLERVQRASASGAEIVVVAPPALQPRFAGHEVRWISGAPHRIDPSTPHIVDPICAPLPTLLPSAAARAALGELHRDRPLDEVRFSASDAAGWLSGLGSRHAGELPGARLVVELAAGDEALAEPLRPGDPVESRMLKDAARAALEDADAAEGDGDAARRLEAAGWALGSPRLAPAWERGQARISIVIAHRDLPAYLPATLASARAQTVPCEIVLVDDGSSAAGLAVVDAEARRDPSLRVIRQANGGPGKARNVGARAATGDLILFLDGDDLLRPACAEQLAEALRRRPDRHLAVPVSRLFDDETGQTVRYYHPLDQSIASLMFICRAGGSCAMHRRAAFLDVQFTEDREVHTEDWDLWFRYIERGFDRRAVVPSVLFEYRQRKQSRLRSISAIEMVYELGQRFALHPSLLAGHAAEIRAFMTALKPMLLGQLTAFPPEIMSAVLEC